MPTIRSYIGDELFTASDYYIHRHIQSIGKANRQSRMGDNELASTFWNYRNQAYQAVKTQYKSLFKGSVIKHETSRQALDTVNMALESDQLMSKINTDIGKALKDALPVNAMRQLMENYLKLENIDFDKMMHSENVEQKIAFFNDFLQILNSASQLIENPQTGVRLGQLLLNSISGENNLTRQDMGVKLLAALNQMKIEMQGMTLSRFDISQIEKVASQLETIANFFKREEGVTETSLSRMLSNVFSEGFAEAISAQINATGLLKIKQGIDKAQLVGAQGVKMVYYDEAGLFKGIQGNKSSGKADVIFPNVQFHLKRDGQIDSQNVNLTISLGVSDKFYRGRKFPGVQQLNNNREQSFSGGKSGSFIRMLKSAVGENHRVLYLAYNTLAYQDTLSTANRALRDIVAIRGLVNFFAARGGQADFAQYMFINGQIVPIWDIIMATSIFMEQRESMNKALYYLVLSDAADQLKQTMERYNSDPYSSNTPAKQVNRVHTLNTIINKINIKSELNLDVLKGLRQLPI